MTKLRHASCRCGQLRAICRGEPMRVSVCHCRNCQRRSGSAFAAQARWPDEQVELAGEASVWTHEAASGRTTFRFCATCGATIAFANQSMPGNIAIPVGAFADPDFPPPICSIYEESKQRWVEITGDGVEHFD